MDTLPNASANHPQRGAVDAHEHAMSLPIREVVRELVELLGATTVAAIGGVQETRAVTEWLTTRSPQRPNVLRFALQIATMIAAGGDQELARAWFHGSNPRLDDEVPALMLRDRPLAEIQAPLLAAARGFAARSPRRPTATRTTPQTAACKPLGVSAIMDYMEAGMAPAFQLECVANADVIHVRGEVDLASSPQLNAMIERTLTDRRLIVDLSNCTYLDSSTLSVLVRAYKVRRAQLQIVVPPDTRIRRLFALTKLDEILSVVPSRAAAFR
jgi:anti-anti-sigma factor